MCRVRCGLQLCSNSIQQPYDRVLLPICAVDVVTLCIRAVPLCTLKSNLDVVTSLRILVVAQRSGASDLLRGRKLVEDALEIRVGVGCLHIIEFVTEQKVQGG
jgi:hypothetical protein